MLGTTRRRTAALAVGGALIGAGSLIGGSAPGSAAIGSAAIDGLILQYHVYVGGVHIIEAEAAYMAGGDDYSLDISAGPVGLLALVTEFRFEASVDGRLESLPMPEEYMTASYFQDYMWTRQLTYQADGSIDVEIDEPTEFETTEPVPVGEQVGTVDPLSGTVLLLEAVRAGDRCTRTVPVFDGKRRYDIVFSQRGFRTLDESDRNVYAGNAILCRGSLTPISGDWTYRSREGDWREDAATDDRRHVDVYVAEVVPGAPHVPVRFEGYSDRGTVYGHLAAVQTLGPDGTRTVVNVTN